MMGNIINGNFPRKIDLQPKDQIAAIVRERLALSLKERGYYLPSMEAFLSIVCNQVADDISNFNAMLDIKVQFELDTEAMTPNEAAVKAVRMYEAIIIPKIRDAAAAANTYIAAAATVTCGALVNADRLRPQVPPK